MCAHKLAVIQVRTNHSVQYISMGSVQHALMYLLCILCMAVCIICVHLCNVCRVQAHLLPQNIKFNISPLSYTALYNRVWRIHATLERGIHLDGKLLAQLSQRKLVAKKEFNDINANLQAHNNSAAGTCFVNSVLFQWLPEEFERNVSQLIEALESHEDRGNQNIARKLHKAYSESKQPLDLEPCHPNPGITADMPSLTVCAGPREHPLQLTPHSTVPNTFGCFFPEEIRLEAGN